MKRDLEKERQWRDTISRWSQSGLSKSEFCRRNGLKLDGLCFWQKEIARRDKEVSQVRTRAMRRRRGHSKPATPAAGKPAEFLEVKVVDDTVAKARTSENNGVIELTAVRLRLPFGCDRSVLLSVLETLR
jgi:hypothetical protein